MDNYNFDYDEQRARPVPPAEKCGMFFGAIILGVMALAAFSLLLVFIVAAWRFIL